MNDTQLLIENLYFKQLLSEEVAFFDQYEPIFGNRTQEFFEQYLDGLHIQKELILHLENLEITEQMIQEKFGDQFAAKVAGVGAKARAGINKLATGGKFGGTLGKWAQNKFGVKGSTTDAGNEAYLKARNQNFIRSVGDYLGQLKTLDKTIPDKVGLVPVKMSGWAGGIWQKGKQLASGAADVAFAGTLFTPAMLTGTAFAGVGGAEKLLRKLNELFDAQWAKLQNLQPVQDFDRLFEVKKKIIRDRLSKIDSSGKETSTIINTIDALGKFGRENPVKSGIIIGLLTFVGGISAATLGLGALTITQFPLLVGAIAFFLNSGFELLTGASASSAVGSGVKAGIGTAAGSAVGGVAGAALSENNSLKLTNIISGILSEADATPPSAPTGTPTPTALTPNQTKAATNLKFNLGKEISTYLKDIAKTFKIKGSSTSQLLDNLKKIPQAKSAVDILDSLMAEFPKYKLEFPKDVVVDDKESKVPPTPTKPEDGGTSPAPGGGGGGSAPSPGGGGGGGGSAPSPAPGGGGGGGTSPAPGGGDKTPEPAKPGTPEPAKPGTPEPAKPGTPEPAKPGTPEPTKPGTPEPEIGTPVTLSPTLVKQLTSVKQNPLVSGALPARIKSMATLKMTDPKDVEFSKDLLQKIKSIVLGNVNRAVIQKQLGGSVAQVRKELVSEAFTANDVAAFTKELTTLIPLLVNITFGLRQTLNPRIPKQPTPAPTSVKEAEISSFGKKNVAQNAAVTEADLKLIKAFLTKVIMLSNSLKALDVNKPTKEKIKPVIADILDILDIVKGKMNPSIVMDKSVTSLFSNIDLTTPETKPEVKPGTTASAASTTSSFKPKEKTIIMAAMKGEDKPLPPSSIYQYVDGSWKYVTNSGVQEVDPVKGKTFVDKLNALSQAGRDDTDKVLALSDKDKKFNDSNRFKNLKEENEFVSPNLYKQFFK